MDKIYVIGAGVEGQEGFSRRSLELIGKADILFGGERQLQLFPEYAGEKVVTGSNLSGMVERLNVRKGSAVVLASGDPLFFGVGRYLLRNLDKNQLEFLPNVSSIQYAFAKIKEPWDDTIFVSAHGRGLKGAVDRIVSNDKAAILTDEINTPAAIAAELIARGRCGYTAYLCENLGSLEEHICNISLQGLLKIEAAPLNVLILIKQFEAAGDEYVPTLGIPDEEFATIKKLITKEEIRVVTLAKLKLRHDMCLWDVGAGSGSVSIEASLLVPSGKVFALEKKPERIRQIEINKNRFGVTNLEIVHAVLPDGLERLPQPDRIFIGGGGRDLQQIINVAVPFLKPGGLVVVNTVLMQNIQTAAETLKALNFKPSIVQVQISRSQDMPWGDRLEAQNPVWIVTGIRNSEWGRGRSEVGSGNAEGGKE